MSDRNVLFDVGFAMVSVVLAVVLIAGTYTENFGTTRLPQKINFWNKVKNPEKP